MFLNEQIERRKVKNLEGKDSVTIIKKNFKEFSKFKINFKISKKNQNLK